MLALKRLPSVDKRTHYHSGVHIPSIRLRLLGHVCRIGSGVIMLLCGNEPLSLHRMGRGTGTVLSM